MVQIKNHIKDLSKQWIAAQKSELKFWEKITKDSIYLNQHANDFQKMIKEILDALRKTGWEITVESQILQIGPGLFDIIDFLPYGKRYTVEPLEEFFRTLNNPHRDLQVERIQGKAENLKFGRNNIDLIISHNMLDHVENPECVFSECYRVLKMSGRIWLRVHTFNKPAIYLKKILLKLKIDNKHLYFWSKEDVRNLVQKNGFKILYERQEPDQRPFVHHLLKREWHLVSKALLGITPHRYTLILKPQKTES